MRPPLPPISAANWLSETKVRLGKCIMFGLDAAQARQAGMVLQELRTDWRQLLGGREGFLVDRKRAGLWRREVAWGEMDSTQKLSNIAYMRYVETARVNWARNYAMHFDPTNRQQWYELCTGMSLKDMRMAYKSPIAWPDHISIFHKLSKLPSPDDNSFILEALILSELHQRPAARCVENIVALNLETKGKTKLRPFMMHAFEQMWESQEKVVETVGMRMIALSGVVRDLERGTWDRKDAVEDMGTVGQR